jgi:hypothetical protein
MTKVRLVQSLKVCDPEKANCRSSTAGGMTKVRLVQGLKVCDPEKGELQSSTAAPRQGGGRRDRLDDKG